MGDEVDVTAIFCPKSAKKAWIIIRISAQDRLVDPCVTNHLDHHGEVRHVGRKIEEVRLRIQRLNTFQLCGEVSISLGVMIFCNDGASQTLKMCDEVLAEGGGIGEKIIRHHIDRLPAAVFKGIFCGGSAHGGIPHGTSELFISQNGRAIERGGCTGGNAHQPGPLGHLAGWASKVEIGGSDNRHGALLHQVFGALFDKLGIALSVDVDELYLPIENTTLLIQFFDRQLRTSQSRLIKIRLNPGLAEYAADEDGTGLNRLNIGLIATA